MALKKRRKKWKVTKKGEKPKPRSKRTFHWITCKKCGVAEQYCETNVNWFICGTCVQHMIPGPALTKTLSPEEKEQRKLRREEREARQAAIDRGETPPPKKDIGFGRGWHKKLIYKLKKDGKTLYFSKGEPITAAEYRKIKKGLDKESADKKATSGFGRGWHFKDVFIAPNGDKYEKGKLVSKAKKKT